MPIELPKRRFTADEYQRMAQTGILSDDDRVELMDGEVVALTPIGPRHNASVNRAARAMFAAVGDSAIVQVQGSVRLDAFHEPEPDIVLLRPREDFYSSQLPGPADILLVVEIAEASFEYDRDIKAGAYAASRIPEYWLVDLRDNSLTCHTDPAANGYHTLQIRHRGESVTPRSLPHCTLPVDAFLVD
jgi:Uma2 family endonuclease